MTDTMATTINNVGFNQSGSCISVATSTGYRTYNCSPFGKFLSEESSDRIGGYAICEMLFQTSLLALVGNGDLPNLSPRKLRLMNTKKHSIICEITFPSSILSVKMNKSRLIILIKLQIYVYDITNVKLLYIIDNISNPYGLISVSSNANILAYPSLSRLINSGIKSNVTSNNISFLKTMKGGPDLNISINNENDSNVMKNGDIILFDMNDLRPIIVIEAHKNGIASLALSSDGKLLATASEKGTIIRIFSVETGLKVYQFRRGTYTTKILSMNFSIDNLFLTACCASKTVHIFKLSDSMSSDNEDSDDDDSDDDESDDSDNDIETLKARKPYVDASRKTVGRMIRNSSQNLTRKAAMTLGSILPIKVNSILDSSRHFASIKLPSQDSSENFNKCAATIGQPVQLHTSDYPELFSNDLNNDANPKIQINVHNNESEGNATTITMLPINVITSEGLLYNYVMDPERGGDCFLLSQYSLLDN
ncbi:hypothetical protein KAFR_0C02420 [Kazachstania africana CBS 2517]|uniref:Autophagy-related protein 18 n=1 Tax=Kazachstania africana (strain ATCC 22294 / BCRC 22015 / CBS 2517 / CECT 1963 / NBRC 1671 / NRRL Y-8276) TaxID=1071382 RepID=H2AS85_KAZAF|nr:hypothetical protein KAFR_0C02420 [Kazachstania africana CBS 2517]CCF57235.1 hypothetical protein KAFR_0C02420 [Kazachstania africana CBS 2517]